MDLLNDTEYYSFILLYNKINLDFKVFFKKQKIKKISLNICSKTSPFVGISILYYNILDTSLNIFTSLNPVVESKLIWTNFILSVIGKGSYI